MSPIKIQDIQTAVNNAQNKIMQQLPLKQDMQLMINNVKMLMTLVQQNQQFLRQAEVQRVQLTRRIAALEARIVQMDQEVKWTRAIVTKMTDRQGQPQTMVLQPDQTDLGDRQQYVFKPA